MKQTLIYTISYVIFSLAFEASLIAFGGLRIPADNAIIAPLILTIPPAVLAIAFSQKRARRFFLLFLFTIVFTLIITQFFVALTGISTGFFEPIVNRGLAGILAFSLTKRLVK